ncbi:Uroporphyrinogen-III synthase [compost metagenome]
MTGWRLLLTRPAEECTALATALAEVEVFSHAMPLLDIEALPVGPQQLEQMRELERYRAVIVVSKPAARLGLELLDQCWPQAPQLAWFSVGAATAQILQARGLNVTFPAQGDDSEALLQLPQLQAAIATPHARVLIMRGEGGRELLAERLSEQGASVDYLQLYRRCLPRYPAAALSQAITEQRLNGLVVSSGQGFEHLQQLAGDDWPQLSQLPLFVPSSRVAGMAQAAGARTVVDCRGASAAALLATLRELPAPDL